MKWSTNAIVLSKEKQAEGWAIIRRLKDECGIEVDAVYWREARAHSPHEWCYQADTPSKPDGLCVVRSYKPVSDVLGVCNEADDTTEDSTP